MCNNGNKHFKVTFKNRALEAGAGTVGGGEETDRMNRHGRLPKLAQRRRLTIIVCIGKQKWQRKA